MLKVGMPASFGIRRRYLTENRAADPRRSASHVSPPGTLATTRLVATILSLPFHVKHFAIQVGVVGADDLRFLAVLGTV